MARRDLLAARRALLQRRSRHFRAEMWADTAVIGHRLRFVDRIVAVVRSRSIRGAFMGANLLLGGRHRPRVVVRLLIATALLPMLGSFIQSLRRPTRP